MTVGEYILARKRAEEDFRVRAGEIGRRLAVVDQAMRLMAGESLIPFDDPTHEAIPTLDIKESMQYLQNHRTQLVMAARALCVKARKLKITINEL